MLNIRIDTETEEIWAYIRIYKSKVSANIKNCNWAELSRICKDFKMKQKQIKNVPDSLYE